MAEKIIILFSKRMKKRIVQKKEQSNSSAKCINMSDIGILKKNDFIDISNKGPKEIKDKTYRQRCQ